MVLAHDQAHRWAMMNTIPNIWLICLGILVPKYQHLHNCHLLLFHS
jgi:hypothetical protein